MWVLLALLAALSVAARESLIKSVMRDGDEVPVAFVIAVAGACILLPAAAFTGAGVADTRFWPALLLSGAINTAAAVMIARAVHVSDLSLAAPLQSTTPLFMLLTGWLLIGEVPHGAGLLGIVVLVAGAWVLGLPGSAPGLLAPLRALLRDPGARLFLAVALLYAVSATADKVGVLASTPLLWAGALNGFIAATLGARLLLRRRTGRVTALLRRAPLRLGAAGVILALGAVAQMAALPLTLAAYVIAVKRTSVLFSVLAGGLLFRERAALQRVAGAAIMVAGVLLIGLG